MECFDVLVVGGGAAGLFCAAAAGRRGLKVLLFDHSAKLAEKIRISGGGRCNFSNRQVTAANFISNNPNFCRSALARYTPQNFTELLQRHGVPFHEKHKGQLFCDRSAEDIVGVLLAECASAQVTRWQPCAISSITSAAAPYSTEVPRYEVECDRGSLRTRAVVIATGGLSIPKIGASDFGYRIARQFGLHLVEPRPALVPLTFDAKAWAPYAQLAGLSLPVQIATGHKRDKVEFLEDLLFTHRGLSGPAVLQISSYWRVGQTIRINLAPGIDLLHILKNAKAGSRKLIANELARQLPARLVDTWIQQGRHAAHNWQRPVNEVSDKALAELALSLTQWELVPTGSEGYNKAEVTAGGVDTRDLSSQSMESRQPGLYFIGEVVDVTGWLGGYNFHWAWASANACALDLADKLNPTAIAHLEKPQ